MFGLLVSEIHDNWFLKNYTSKLIEVIIWLFTERRGKRETKGEKEEGETKFDR